MSNKNLGAAKSLLCIVVRKTFSSSIETKQNSHKKQVKMRQKNYSVYDLNCFLKRKELQMMKHVLFMRSPRNANIWLTDTMPLFIGGKRKKSRDQRKKLQIV